MLPRLGKRAEYEALHGRDEVWVPAVQAIAQRHALESANWQRAQSGSHVVFLGDGRVIKLFAPFWADDARAERLALEVLPGFAVPEILASGELEGWPYLVLRLVDGRPASEVWHELDATARRDVMVELGTFIGRMREHRVAALQTDWDRFLEERKDACPDHHRVPESWHAWIDERVGRFEEPPFEPVLLHADLTDEHIFLVQRAGRWRLSGVIDFGDAMMGHPLYEFIAPACFLAFGNPPVLRDLVEASGLPVDEELRARLTTYCLLHRYGRLEAFLQRHPVADGATFERSLWE